MTQKLLEAFQTTPVITSEQIDRILGYQIPTDASERLKTSLYNNRTKLISRARKLMTKQRGTGSWLVKLPNAYILEVRA